jgi:hypothetical protein
MGAAMMADAIFDHDRLDVYRLAIEYTSQSFMVAKDLSASIVTPATNGCERANRFR